MLTKKVTVLTVAAILTTAAMSQNIAVAQEQDSVRQVLNIYLMQDCGTGEKDPSMWIQKVVALGDTVVPLLLKAVREGPPSEELADLERDARRDFGSLQEFMRQGGLSNLENKDVVKVAQEFDEETYVRMRLQSFVRGHQERALNALQEMGGPAILESLREIAGQPELAKDLKKTVIQVIEWLESTPSPKER